MNILDALQKMKEGKKIREKSWPVGAYLELTSDGEILDEHGENNYSIHVCSRIYQTEEWEIWKEPILDKKEREYLSAVIKPFKDKVSSISKTYSVFGKKDEYILIWSRNGTPWTFPTFEKGTMYKRMAIDKRYTLEELGL